MEKVVGKHLCVLFLFTLVVAFFCSKMSPFYSIQEWSDVNLYFNIGKAIMNGKILYVDVFDHKGPLIFFIYGIGTLLSSTSFLGIFILQYLVWSIISYFCYRITLLQFKSNIALLVACIFLSLFISHTSQGGSAEEFIACCMMISLYLYVRFFQDTDIFQKNQKKDFFIQGLLFGIVFSIKFNLCVFWLFPFLASLYVNYKQCKIKFCLGLILFFVIGFLFIITPIFVYFWVNGAVIDAITSYVLVNSNQKLDLLESFSRITISFYQRLRFEFVEFSIILIGAFVYPFVIFKDLVVKLSIPLSFLVLFASIFLGGYVYYYSIPYYIYVSLGIVCIFYFINHYINVNKMPFSIVLVFILLLTCFSIYRKHFFDKYYTNQMNVITYFSPYIENEKDRTLINLGLDESNALFTYADIMPNVKYFIAPNLSDKRFPELRQAQSQYIIDKRTNFVILAEYTNNAYFFYNFQPLKDNYEVVATYEEYYEWQKVNRKIYLYKRKTNE